MAGFTLSGALFRKKCGALHLEKTGDLFLLITLVVHSGIAHYFGRPISGMQIIRRSFCGAPFCGGPCSAEHAEHA